MTTIAVIALVALLLVDFAVIGLHLWHEWGAAGHAAPEWVQGPEFWLATDGGIAEWLKYLQLSTAAGLSVVVAARHGAPVLAAWAFTCAVAVADDALMLHDKGGSGSTLSSCSQGPRNWVSCWSGRVWRRSGYRYWCLPIAPASA